MSANHYLLFIDQQPVSDDLKRYFSQFKIDIVQQSTLKLNDINLQTLNGLLIHWNILQHQPELINRYYTQYSVPLLIIDDEINEEVCVRMLEEGADDYITKPIYPRELHARITAISRRVQRGQQKSAQDKQIISFAGWTLYTAARQIFDENACELQLSAGEYDLLLTFIQQPQKILNREHLLEITKNSALNPFDRRIDVQISRLRQKIEIDPKKPVLIKTIRNGGYMFTAPIYRK